MPADVAQLLSLLPSCVQRPQDVNDACANSVMRGHEGTPFFLAYVCGNLTLRAAHSTAVKASMPMKSAPNTTHRLYGPAKIQAHTASLVCAGCNIVLALVGFWVESLELRMKLHLFTRWQTAVAILIGCRVDLDERESLEQRHLQEQW